MHNTELMINRKQSVPIVNQESGCLYSSDGATMVLQNLKLYRLHRLNTFQRLNSISEPIPEHKER